ncbi:unnamed protein product, partial [Mesorhabditis belari]|uniref:Leucine-rich repeat-containing protein 57 n=1 Tax=Mesorhabditis belari TaxID=2138241 RepID=A0AAF3EUU4_9BILA
MGNEGSKGKPKSGPSKTIQGAISEIRGGPSSSTVTKHMEMARKSRILQLKGANLKKVPDNIAELCDVLRNLELSQNRISSIPPFIGHFNQLKQLHLSANNLDSLPDEIGSLNALEVLNLSENSLGALPDSLSNCANLRTLNLDSNEFQRFPNVVISLLNLDILNLAKNKIAELPENIDELNAAEVNLNQNQLASLAPNLSKCPRLKILRVEENCLPKTAFTKALLESSPVSIIAYSGNLFQESDFQSLPGYEDYQLRYTATKRKM